MGIEIRGEVEAALEIWPCGYRIKCNASGCTNLARIIVRRVRGTFDGQNEYCNKGLAQHYRSSAGAGCCRP